MKYIRNFGNDLHFYIYYWYEMQNSISIKVRYMWEKINENMIFKRTISQQIQSNYFDLRFGGRLLDDEKYSPYFNEGCYHTQSIEYEELELIFSHVILSASDVIMDVGCGRGRLFNYLLSIRFAGKMYGVEIDPEIGEVTKHRLKKYNNISIYIGNALEFVRSDVNLYFLFCPFNG